MDLPTGVISQYEDAVIYLLKDKSFYARLILSMRKYFNDKVPTAGVSMSSTGFNLYINPKFFNELENVQQRSAVLVHECLHCIHKHLTRFLFKRNGTADQGRNARIANIACDLAINQYIQGLPDKCVTLEGIKKLDPSLADLEPYQSAEYYYERIKEYGDTLPPEYGEFDDHSTWGESDLTEEQQAEAIKAHIKAVHDACKHDNNSGIDSEMIDRLFRSNINWKNQLSAFVNNAQEIFYESSRMKMNRRYQLKQPGRRTEPRLILGVPVDTSGSMSQDSLNMIFGELDRMCFENVDIHVIEADAEIQNVYKYKRGMKVEVKGRGGTAYSPAIDYCKNELECDAIIYMGDMDSADQPTNPKIPVLWCIVGEQMPPGNFGKILRLP